MGKHGYKMTPKGMGGQAYRMMGGQDPKKKKTKMVSLVPRDKSGKPIPQVRGGAGLFGYIGPGSGLKAAANIKNLSSAARQAKAVFKPKAQAELSTATLKMPKRNFISGIKQGISAGKKIFKAFRNAPKQYLSKTKNVPVVGKPGKTVKVPKSSKTKQVSYVNPRISMTAKERLKAGY